MRYMLDTNICIYVMKNHPETVVRRFKEHAIGDICISTVTYHELMYGVEKSNNPQRNRTALAMFLSPIEILEYDELAAEDSGRIRAELKKRGTPIGPLDTMIAGHARSKGYTLVTNNTREFERVEGLELENWTE